MKKLIAIVLSSLLLIGAAVGGTLALASDEERTVNVYTAGNIDIALVNGDNDSLTLFPAVYNFADYDTAEKAFAKTDAKGYWTALRNVYQKDLAVVNVGENAAYIRVIVAYENPEIDDNKYFFDECVVLNEVTAGITRTPLGNAMIDGTNYALVSYLFADKVTPDKDVKHVVLRQLALKTETTSEQMAKIGENYNLLVCAQAVQTDLNQSEGGNSPEAMLNEAFGALSVAAHPWVAPNNPGTIVSTVAELKAAIENGGVITLTQDIESADGLLITDKNVTINLAGNTITVSEGASTNNRVFKINGSSNVTIKNGTLIAKGELTSGAYGTIRTEGTANVTLENMKLYSYRGYGLNVKACTGSVVTINNSEIYAKYSGGVEAAGGTIVLNNSKIVQEGVYSGGAWCSVAIGVNGGGKAVVNSGSYSASAIATDSNAAQGTWVAYVMTSGGTLEINGGTFNGTIAETAAAANACGIICADTAAVVTIKGGAFNSNGAILDMRNNDASLNPVATLVGGTFSADPRVSGLYSSNLIKVAPGFAVTQSINGFWTVDVKESGLITPETFKDAINKAADGDSLILAPGDYSLRFTNDTSFNVDNLTIIGTKNVKLTITSSEVWYGRIQGNNVTFENINFVNVNGSVGATGKATYNNCTFAGILELASSGGAETYVNNCKMDNIHTSTEMNAGAAYVKGSTMVLAEYNARAAMNFENCAIGTLLSHGGNTVLTNCKVDSIVIKGGTVIIDGKYFVNSATSLQAALNAATGNTVNLALAAGNYTMPEPDLRGKTLTIKGTKDTVIDVSAVDARNQFVTGATVVFEGVTLNFGTANYMGFANTASLTYKNCTINGLQFLFGENVTFEDCVLNSNGAEHCVWTYGVKNVSFTNCSFTYGDRGINCYSDNDIAGGKQTVNFTNCTFATENTASEGAVEINSCSFSVGIEVNLNGCTAPAYGKLAYVSRWDSTNGAKTTINVK